MRRTFRPIVEQLECRDCPSSPRGRGLGHTKPPQAPEPPAVVVIPPPVQVIVPPAVIQPPIAPPIAPPVSHVVGVVNETAGVQWRIDAVPKGVTLEQMQWGVAHAIQAWAVHAPVRYDGVVVLRTGTLERLTYNATWDGTNITFSDTKIYSLMTGLQTGAGDVRRLLVHEFGHVFGLGHAHFRAASVMASPAIAYYWQLQPWDIAAIQTRWGTRQP